MRILLLCLLLLPTTPAEADSRAEPATFDVRYLRMARAEAFFVQDLFERARELAHEGRLAAAWLASGGLRGTEFRDYRERADALLAELSALEAPVRVEEFGARVLGSLRLQRDFLADWARARDEGREFSSQLTSEFGYHEGLHRSRRERLRAYERALALFPDEDAATRRAFFDELGALDLRARPAR